MRTAVLEYFDAEQQAENESAPMLMEMGGDEEDELDNAAYWWKIQFS
jgi:hypothetical protein